MNKEHITKVGYHNENDRTIKLQPNAPVESHCAATEWEGTNPKGKNIYTQLKSSADF